MTDIGRARTKRSWLRRHGGKVLVAALALAIIYYWYTGQLAQAWGKVTVVVMAASGFLILYSHLRNKAPEFFYDLANLVGLRQLIPMRRDKEAEPGEADQLAVLNHLKSMEDRLSTEQSEKLRQLENSFIERAFEVLERAQDVAGAPGDAQANPDAREAVRETIEQGEADARRALAVISDDDVGGDLGLLSDLAAAAMSDNAEQWRRIGRLAYGVDTSQALGAYRKVIALDQSDPWDAIYLGRLHQRNGSLTDAYQTFVDALDGLPEVEERDRAVLFDSIGDVLSDQGDLAAALESYGASMAIVARLAQADPSNAQLQRDLSVSFERNGDVLRGQGDLAAALESYRASMDIRTRLAQADPSNVQLQRDLSVTFNKIGDVLSGQGDLAAALESYRPSMDIRTRLAQADPSNAKLQRDLSVSFNKIGDVLSGQGDLAAALESYRASMASS